VLRDRHFAASTSGAEYHPLPVPKPGWRLLYGTSAETRPYDSMIVVDGLAKRYGQGLRAVMGVRDISFEVNCGEAVALLGRNGAGKSTTVRMLATITKPTAGRALIAGYDIEHRADAIRPLLGVALQHTGLPRRQTARRLLNHHGRLHGLSRGATDRRVRELIDMFGLHAVADRQIWTYSGGQRRRLDVALALVHRPPVMLFDEPTAGLDAQSRAAIWEQLHAYLDAGTALVFTTHDLREADEHADDVVIINAGVVIARGTPRELKRRLGSRRIDLVFGSAAEARRALSVLGRGELTDVARVMVPLTAASDLLKIMRSLDEAQLTFDAVSLLEPTLDGALEDLLGMVGSSDDAALKAVEVA
jgi:ABC-type multidrug transport system ATPase subunit